MNHHEMRGYLCSAFARVIGRAGTVPELQLVQAISSLETNNGQGWKPPGDKSKNLGAQQAGSNWTGKTFEYRDTSPQSDGTSVSYVTKFRFYDTWEQAADDLIRTVYVSAGRSSVLAAASAQDSLRFSAGLYCVSGKTLAERNRERDDVITRFGISPTGYYQGFGKTPGERIQRHHDRVVASVRAQALALGEELPADIAALPAPVPLLRLGAQGAGVVKLQQLLNARGANPQLKTDGAFGAQTDAAVRAFQRR